MSIIKCPECKNSVSDKSEKCVHCGYPIYIYSKTPKKYITCNYCGSRNEEGTENCQNCNALLNKSDESKKTDDILYYLPTKICKSCGKVIYKSSKTCTYCFAKQEEPLIKKLKIAGIVFAGFFLWSLILSNAETETETLDTETETLETETESETTKEYTEEEYKSLCEEMYNDDFFKSTPDVGKYVKVQVMVSLKYKYFSSDIRGIIVKDITKKYDLAMNCLGCTVLHESTKDDPVPSYYGEYIYIMFVDGAEINLDTFKPGQKITIYGEVIQNVNGIYILPKYYE